SSLRKFRLLKRRHSLPPSAQRSAPPLQALLQPEQGPRIRQADPSRESEPVLIGAALVPSAKSAMDVFPDRCEITTVRRARRSIARVSKVSDNVSIRLILIKTEFATPILMPSAIRSALVTMAFLARLFARIDSCLSFDAHDTQIVRAPGLTKRNA